MKRRKVQITVELPGGLPLLVLPWGLVMPSGAFLFAEFEHVSRVRRGK